MTDLKPCPFCGGEPEHETHSDGMASVHCVDCGVRSRRGVYAFDGGAEEWNTRAPLPDPPVAA